MRPNRKRRGSRGRNAGLVAAGCLIVAAGLVFIGAIGLMLRGRGIDMAERPSATMVPATATVMPTDYPTAIATELPTRTEAPTIMASPEPLADRDEPRIQSEIIEAPLAFGRVYSGDGWQVYFNEPDSRGDAPAYVNGIDAAAARAIDSATSSIDIAVFELNSAPIASALLAAHQRGLAVRMVTDDEHGLEDQKDSAIRDLAAAGLPVVDDSRSGLMHNKFMILDGRSVWTGSWNYTVNGSYRNNNNVLVLQNAAAAEAFQAEFDEMFLRGEFGTRSRDDGIVNISGMNSDISIIFASEAEEIAALAEEIGAARESIRFMSFVFSLGELADAMIAKMAEPGFVLNGIFEKRNSTASWSQLPALHCAGAHVRQDGSRYVLHHKVIIIDDDTVITGSFNFSNNAAKNNDENIVIVRNADIAGLYLDEWRRMWDSAQELSPGDVSCA